DIPVVAVVWNYPGLSAEDMERRVVIISERAYSSTVDGISRIESQSIPGIGLLKIYFQPDADIGGAIAQISSVSSTILRITPPGMQAINVMTLGGLALAIGMLVDDATVEVENIHRNRSLGKPLTVAILDGASQIAVPAIVATLAICIVFFPVV